MGAGSANLQKHSTSVNTYVPTGARAGPGQSDRAQPNFALTEFQEVAPGFLSRILALLELAQRG